MLKDITIGQYFPGVSPVHKLDPRIKILITGLYIGAVFTARSLLAYVVPLAFMLFTVLLSQLPIKFLLKGLRPILMLVVITFGLNLFFSPGETVLLQWKFIRVTQEGLFQAIHLLSRLVLLVLGTSLLTLTTSPIALTDGLERLLWPFSKIGLPVHELAMMMTIALRFIPTLLSEADRIMKAQMARGADFESGNLIKRAQAMVPLLVPLFVSAFRRADDLAMAMEARCYQGGTGRTRMKVLKLSPIDGVAIVVATAVLVGTLLL